MADIESADEKGWAERPTLERAMDALVEVLEREGYSDVMVLANFAVTDPEGERRCCMLGNVTEGDTQVLSMLLQNTVKFAEVAGIRLAVVPTPQIGQG